MKYIDPDGKDWFVNNENGNLTYLKGIEDLSKLNQDQLDKYKMGDVSQYEHLGADNMFGDKIMQKGANLLDRESLSIKADGTAQTFMVHFGYETADRLTVKETETVQYTFGQEKGGTRYSYDSKQIGEAKITYVKPENMDQKQILKDKPSDYTFSRTREVIYATTKPTGVYQKSYFEGQKLGSTVGASVTALDATINILEGLFGK
ncbi:hypothetical protein [Dysgonomonas sp. GY617]|uniref:hypothetical protein n=1 Tax=Dysgonomonas sp. GY617 TaxID=2780420 RepID=UPI001883EFB9|nr:hypothetical protein [Dysgonomonas sp. GY617]MBF0576018.1 hypothetical protein [Dysgonomonas sp. GY617]